MPDDGKVGEKWGVPANMGEGVAFERENALKCIVLMAAQFCEYTKSHGLVHFK